MKHYIVTYEGRLWLSFAKNPKEAINQIIVRFGINGDWHDFKARSVGSIVAENGNVTEFKVVDAE